MSARDRILDTLEAILISEGERGATLDAVAAKAGVSKGGLLYHFRNRDALVVGLLDRLLRFAEEDRASMASSPEGPSAYYLTTSATTGTPFDRTLIAVTRLGIEKNARAGETIRAIQQGWFELLSAEIGDAGIARAIMLMGDGLYYNAAFGSASMQEATDLSQLLRVLDGLKRAATHPG